MTFWRIWWDSNPRRFGRFDGRRATEITDRSSAGNTLRSCTPNAPLDETGLSPPDLFICKCLNLLDLLAGSTGLEPAASGVTGRRSNQLNYDPK